MVFLKALRPGRASAELRPPAGAWDRCRLFIGGHMPEICGRRAVIGQCWSPLWKSSVRSFTQFSTRQIDVRAPFLTGSAPQTEFTVSHSKQTLEKFLTGARMHIKDFEIRQLRTQELCAGEPAQAVPNPSFDLVVPSRRPKC